MKNIDFLENIFHNYKVSTILPNDRKNLSELIDNLTNYKKCRIQHLNIFYLHRLIY
jgi:hypothetical protein